MKVRGSAAKIATAKQTLIDSINKYDRVHPIVEQQWLAREESGMARYRVEMKKFKDGSWYTKTETDSIAAAYSVARCHSDGREYNIIDTETDSIIAHEDEDPSMKEFVTSKEGFQTMHPLW